MKMSFSAGRTDIEDILRRHFDDASITTAAFVYQLAHNPWILAYNSIENMVWCLINKYSIMHDLMTGSWRQNSTRTLCRTLGIFRSLGIFRVRLSCSFGQIKVIIQQNFRMPCGCRQLFPKACQKLPHFILETCKKNSESKRRCREFIAQVNTHKHATLACSPWRLERKIMPMIVFRIIVCEREKCRKSRVAGSGMDNSSVIMSQ